MPVTFNDFSFHIQHNGYPVMHDHKGAYEFIFVMSGEILHKINDDVEILTKNTLCFLTPSDCHSLNKNTDDSIYISLSITTSHFEKLLDWISPTLRNKSFYRYEKYKIPGDHALEIVQLTNKILLSPPAEYYEFLHILTCYLVHEILTSQQGARIKNCHNAVKDFLHLLEDVKNLSVPLTRLIWETGYSYTQHNKLFLQNLGMSVGKYFSKKKLDYAITAIKCSEQTLQTISEALGFSTYSHFSSYFKKCTGISPLQYRQISSATIPGEHKMQNLKK